jgi:hypothetical protein
MFSQSRSWRNAPPDPPCMKGGEIHVERRSKWCVGLVLSECSLGIL